jgi:two-component system NtrC family sensor kinase
MNAIRTAPGLSRSRLRMPLFVKFAVAFVGLVSFVLVVNGAVNLWLSYEEAKSAAVRVQHEKALAAAERIDQFIFEIEQHMGWTTHQEWHRIGLEQQRYDFIRLLRQAPAITEAKYLDGNGREQLKVSRLEPDSIASQTDFSAEPLFANTIENRIWLGPVYFRRGSEPYMTIAMAHTGRNPGVTAAEVNLKFIWDVITSIRIGQAGYAFVVTAQGRLVAHPDLSLVLRDTDLSRLPQVAAALTTPRPDNRSYSAAVADGIDGDSVLTAYAPISRLGWIVFVQLPAREAMAPVYNSLVQTGALLGLGLLLATMAGTVLARRMVVPIRRLQRGAERLGQGALNQRLEIRTGDEIETLADCFNQMAASVQESHETLEAKVERRTQALQQQEKKAREARHAAERALADLKTAQQRLIQSEKLASLGQLTAGIAHEIKNPLNFINNFADVSAELVQELRDALVSAPLDDTARMEVDDLSEMLKTNLGKIVQHGRRADSVIKNMLLHSREGTGERRSVDLNAIVEESLNLAYHGARAGKPDFNVMLRKDLDPTVGSLEIYPQEFVRVLLNLITNGFYAGLQRKAQTEHGAFEPTLTVSTKAFDDRIEIRVRDNGTGIPDEVRAKMFNPFFTTKPAGEGTGLGLSLSFDIVVNQHGGIIDVETRPGEFTEFIVILPRATGPVANLRRAS